MARPKKPRVCSHVDRLVYAHGLCKSCYDISRRNPETKLRCDRDYEDRHRQERNENRRARAAMRRAAIKDANINNGLVG